MQKTIIIAMDRDKPIRDVIKDEYEKVERKTEEGVEFYYLIERVKE